MSISVCCECGSASRCACSEWLLPPDSVENNVLQVQKVAINVERERISDQALRACCSALNDQHFATDKWGLKRDVKTLKLSSI